MENEKFYEIKGHFKDLKEEYHILMESCLKALEFNKHILSISTTTLNPEQENEVKNLNISINKLYENLMAIKGKLEKD